MRSMLAVAFVLALGAHSGAAPAVPPLLAAVRAGDIAAVRALVDAKADVHAAERDGTTALHWAAHTRRLDIADVLLGAGANPNAANRYGSTPLWEACINGDAALIARLLDAGADANTMMAEGDTALMTAARAGSAESVRLLIAAGANVNAAERWKGQTALMWAAARNNVEAVAALVAAGANVQARTLHRPYPERKGPPRKTRGHGTQLDVTGASGFTALLFAVRAGARDAVTALLAAGATVDDTLADGTSALVVAVASAQYDIAAYLLERGANPNAAAQGWAPLHQIVWTRRPNTGSNNPWPVPRGRVDSLGLARQLIAAGADVNARITRDADIANIGRRRLTEVGATPFWLASLTVDVAMMRLLAEQGADPLLPNSTGTTPLMAAAGIGIEMPGENAGTPEEVAEAVAFNLERGGRATDVDVNGETALHGAAHWGSNRAIEQLVAAGARLDARNHCGWTPWDIANGVAYDGNVIGNTPETAALLRQLMEARGVWTPRSAPAPAC